MALSDTLDSKEEVIEFGHFVFIGLAPISKKQKRSGVIVMQIQHIPINLSQEEIKRLKKKTRLSIHQSNQKHENKKMKPFSKDPQGVLHKKRKDHRKKIHCIYST